MINLQFLYKIKKQHLIFDFRIVALRATAAQL